ncbi:MAG: HTH domain-containing protein [Clostridium sp.]
MNTNIEILEVLKASPLPLKGGEIAEKLGVDKKIIDKAIKNLKTEGRITSPKRCYYTISE